MDFLPQKSKNLPITKEAVISQISKTGNTPFEFENIEINLDENLFVPIKVLNELRRASLQNLEEKIFEEEIYSRKLVFKTPIVKEQNKNISSRKITLLLNILDKDVDYTKFIKEVDKLYIPLKYFLLNDYKISLQNLSKNFNLYVYLPSILRDNFKLDFDKLVNDFKIKGFVVSSISQLDLVKKYNLELIGNYTLNVYNSFSVKTLKDFGIETLSITPELNDYDTKALIKNTNIPLELLVYGNIPLMTMNYCLIRKIK